MRLAGAEDSPTAAKNSTRAGVKQQTAMTTAPPMPMLSSLFDFASWIFVSSAMIPIPFDMFMLIYIP